jgi:tripartite-type tricarboxylate transporter receptor subunit TctC
VAKLNQAINEVLTAPETVEVFQKRNMQPIGGTPEDASRYLKEEGDMWRNVIRAAEITAE